MPRSWQDLVRAAETKEDVLDLAKDFIAQFSPMEIAQLPQACRPGKFLDARDVTEYAFDLARHRCDEAEGAGYLIQRLAAFFTDANERLSEILHVPPERSGGGYRPFA